MNLEDIQSKAKELIKANPELSGVPVLADDGTYPQTPYREAALEKEGLVVIVWEPVSGENSSLAKSRRLNMEVELPISIENNRAINFSTGLNLHPAKVLRLVISSLGGKPVEDPFESANPPFANFGVVDGIGQSIANFKIKSVI